MQNIKITRYDNPAAIGYAGCVEPEDRTWVMFVGLDGRPVFYLHRDSETGAVLPDDPADRAAAASALEAEQARRAAWVGPVEGVHYPIFVGEQHNDRPMPPASFRAFDAGGEVIGERRDGVSPDGFVSDGMLVARMTTVSRHAPESMALAL